MTDKELALIHLPPKRHARSLTPESLARMRALKAQGLTNRQLAERFGIHICSVSAIFKADS